MSHSIDVRRRSQGITGEWIRTIVALVLAVGCGLLLARLLLAPHADDMRLLAGYLTLSAAGTIGGGWLAMRAIDGAVALSIRTKAVCTALTGTAVSLLNVLIVAQLMFVSTSHDLRLLIALIGFSAIVTAVFSLWVASSTASRLQTIAHTLRALASGRYGERAAIAGHDEVASLATDINALATKLQTVEAERAAVDAQRRELTAAISHDLRTPLSTIRAMVDALDDGVVSERSEMKRYFATIRRDVERLNRMIDDLFELAQIDAGAMRLRLQPVAVDEIVSEVVDAMRARAELAGVQMDLSIDDHLSPAMLDGDRLERAVGNLLRNALEHVSRGGQVHVRVSGNNGQATVEVSDTGEGIDEEDLPHIWTRFYRADRSRTRTDDASDGAGLGLAITKGIVELHGGKVDVRSHPGTGSVFTLELPVNGSRDSRVAHGVPSTR